MTQVESHPRRTRRSAQHAGQHGGAFGPPPTGGNGGGGDRAPRPAPRGGPRRGRHATPLGQGFSWVTLWTIVGAVLPGSGLVAAGRRTIGGLVLGLAGLGLLGLAASFLVGNPVKRLIGFAVDPQKLLIMALVIGVGALIWAGLILLTHAELRRYASLTGGQRAFSVVVVLALLGGLALPAYKVGSYAMIQRDLISAVTDGADSGSGLNPDEKKADPWANIPRMNVLLIGSDAGRGRVGIRPDTLILASIDTRSGNTVLFSFPRNLERVPFPIGSPGARAWPNGFYCAADQCLLNAIWTWADGPDGRQYYRNDKNPGLKATEQAVEGITGLKVDTYAMLNLKGFAEFINAIGGLRLNVAQRLPIGGNSENPVAVGGYIEAGRNQKLNGYQSLWYARSRWSTNDYDRMRRQRCVIGAVVSQANPGKMALAFPRIARAAKDNISTGIRQEDLQAWVELATRVQGAKVTSLPFTNQVVADRANPDFEQIRSLVQKSLRESMAKPRSSATPTTGATSPTGSSTGGSTKAGATPRASATPDPSKAQDVKAVC